MPRDIPSSEDALVMLQRVDEQYRPVWDGRPCQEQAALALYFLPHHSAKPVLTPTRPRLIKWYCPFACQSQFPSGHRYCINVFTGCSHCCEYCYAKSYSPDVAASKRNFEHLLALDLADLDRFDVPPAPVHLSNSTDCFQPLEIKAGHTRLVLEQILKFRHRFTTVTLLTKNPKLAAQPPYIELLQQMCALPTGHPCAEKFAQEGRPGCCVEVSMAFWRDDAGKLYDRCAPSVDQRIEGIHTLRQAGIPLVLRIDPLFPRFSLEDGTEQLAKHEGLPEPQSLEDLEHLVGFAKDMQVRHVVHSPCKICQPRGRKLSDTMRAMRAIYERVASPDPLVFHGGSWRLPRRIADTKVTEPFLDICRRHGVKARYCMHNLIETP